MVTCRPYLKAFPKFKGNEILTVNKTRTLKSSKRFQYDLMVGSIVISINIKFAY
jgi:hypothetical protein